MLRKRKKSTGYRKIPRVFAVHKSETADSRFHEVLWARDRNLNAAYKRGNIKGFRMWPLAKGFASRKAKRLGATLSIS